MKTVCRLLWSLPSSQVNSPRTFTVCQATQDLHCLPDDPGPPLISRWPNLLLWVASDLNSERLPGPLRVPPSWSHHQKPPPGSKPGSYKAHFIYFPLLGHQSYTTYCPMPESYVMYLLQLPNGFLWGPESSLCCNIMAGSGSPTTYIFFYIFATLKVILSHFKSPTSDVA